MDTRSKKVAVLGAGSWGTALANVFADGGCDVTIWGRDPQVVETIEKTHENPSYLKGIALHPELKATTHLSGVLSECEMVVLSIPSQQLRKVLTPVAQQLLGKVVINTAKGIEEETLLCMSEILSSIAPGATYVVLSGPSFAFETAKRLPTALTLACREERVSTEIQKFLPPYFRTYRSQDVIGVELAGALKNVIAIASGIVTGMKLGYNAQAALINRGMAEISRLGKRKGADPMTFLGLSGMGDLILTCTGPLSRNRTLGLGLGEGKPFQKVVQELGGVAEGVNTARSAYLLSKKFGLEMPITEQVYRILYEGASPEQAFRELMSRELRNEWEPR